MQTTLDKPSTELTLPQRAGVALGAAKHETELRELVKASNSIVAVTNPDGREQAHRAAITLRNARIGIAVTGKSAREDATAFSKAIIAEEKRLIEIIEPEETRVFGLRDAFDTKVAAERQAKIDAERARVDAIRARILEISRTPLMASGQPSVVIDRIIQSLIDEEIGDDFQEFADAANAAKQSAIDALNIAIKTAMDAEVAAQQAAAEREAEAASMAAERLAIAKDRAELAERNAEQDRVAKIARDEADRVRKLEDDARTFRMNQERDALLAERTAIRLEQEKLDDKKRLQAIEDQALADARKPVEISLSVTTEPADEAAIEHFKEIVAELLIDRTGGEVRELLEEVLADSVEA